MGCSGVYYSPRQSETISRGVHGTSKAIDAGQIQVADTLIKETAKIVPPPRKGIEILPVKKDGGKVVILPSHLSGEVVLKDSKSYSSLLADKENKRALSSLDSSVSRFEKEVAARQIEERDNSIKKDTLIDKQKDKISSLVKYRNIVWGVAGLVGLAFLAVVILFLLKIAGKVA